MGSVALSLFALLAVVCLGLGALRWVQRRAADMRGRRLPPMRLL